MAQTCIQCPKCSFKCKHQKKFDRHLLEEHSIEDSFQLYLDLYHGGKELTCACGCGTLLKWKGWKHGYPSRFVRGHNAVIDTCFNDPEIQRSSVQKRKEGYAAGKYTVWNAGKTRDSDDRIARMADKAGQTTRKQYQSGSRVPWQLGYTKETHPSLRRGAQKKRLSEKEVLARIAAQDEFELVSPIENYTRRQRERLVFRCKAHGHLQEKSLEMIENTPHCFKCDPQSSWPEKQLYKWVQKYSSHVKRNVRDVIPPKELDIWIPEHDLAIEYNGLSWHTELSVADDYHWHKSLECQEKGISLIHVYSDDWRYKNKIVKSMIQSRLGATAHRVGARKCKLQKISREQRREFFNQNHIDGDSQAKIAWGLFDEEGIVAALSLRQPHHRKWRDENRLEVCRFASRLNTNVPGGLSRLTSAALRYCKGQGLVGLMTYVSLDYGTGDSYTKAGFNHVGWSGKQFWWTDRSRRYNRFQCRADSERGLTEKQVAREKNWYKIWGCPNRILKCDAVPV